jgi:hypothetical protein
MEALQLLKYIYKQDRLDFTQDVLAREEHYRIEGEVMERCHTMYVFHSRTWKFALFFYAILFFF